MVDVKNHSALYRRVACWAKRSGFLYYKYVDNIFRTVTRNARSLVDVGTGNSPHLGWIEDRASIDMAYPYKSATVRQIEGDIFDFESGVRFDFCTCLQVLEHLVEPARFAKRLFQTANHVVISAPDMWEPGTTPGYVRDPISLKKLTSWVRRNPDYHIRAREPFRKKTSTTVRILSWQQSTIGKGF